jgi:hypothetical protein
MEFAIPVWSPMRKRDINSMERVQYRATRMVKGFGLKPYEDSLDKLGIQALSERRKRGDLIQLFKIFKGTEEVELMAKQDRYQSHRGHNKTYVREQTKDTIIHEFLTNRTVNVKISHEAINAATMNVFKARLDRAQILSSD